MTFNHPNPTFKKYPDFNFQLIVTGPGEQPVLPAHAGELQQHHVPGTQHSVPQVVLSKLTVLVSVHHPKTEIIDKAFSLTIEKF